MRTGVATSFRFLASKPAVLSASWMTATKLMRLSPRQHEVARLVERGYASFEIAHVLGVSTDIVQQELEEIFVRLAIGSRHELVELMRTVPEKLPAGFRTFDWSSITARSKRRAS